MSRLRLVSRLESNYVGSKPRCPINLSQSPNPNIPRPNVKKQKPGLSIRGPGRGLLGCISGSGIVCDWSYALDTSILGRKHDHNKSVIIM